MKTLLFFTFLTFLIVACQNNDDDEFNREHIAGEYTGSLIYWHSMEESGTFLSSTDPTKGWEFKTSVQRVGSNYIMSFDKSFIYKIPDITVEITPTKNSDVYAITTLSGQAYNSLINQNTYNNQASNYFAISRYPQEIGRAHV